MADLYNVQRPAPIPVEEHERRRRAKDTAEIVQASAWSWSARCQAALRSFELERGLHGIIPLVSPLHTRQAAKKRGKSEAYVHERLNQLESLLPDLINLHKLKASDW